MKTKGWIIAILGVWVLLTPFAGFGHRAILWNDLLVGAVLAVTGFTLVKSAAWQGWTAGVLGLWLIVAAFIYGLHVEAGLLWNNVLVGAVTAIAGFATIGRREATRPGMA